MISVLCSFAGGFAFHTLAKYENSTFDKIFRCCINEGRGPYQEELIRYLNSIPNDRLSQLALVAEIAVPLVICALSGSSFAALYIAFNVGLLVCSIVKNNQRNDVHKLFDSGTNLFSNIYTAFTH